MSISEFHHTMKGLIIRLASASVTSVMRVLSFVSPNLLALAEIPLFFRMHHVCARIRKLAAIVRDSLKRRTTNDERRRATTRTRYIKRCDENTIASSFISSLLNENCKESIKITNYEKFRVFSRSVSVFSLLSKILFKKSEMFLASTHKYTRGRACTSINMSKR